jgi:hypothetical protein
MLTRWSKDAIALEILRAYAAGDALSYGEVQKNNLRLLRAATRYFGSWKNAIEYAGLDYDRIRRYRVWTRERIVEQIRRHHRDGRDLSWRHVSTALDPALAAAAIRANRFGSWERALEAAGLDYAEIRRHRAWDGEAVLAELRRRNDAGESLRVSDVAEECAALVAAARRHFDGWYEAVEAAGLDELQARLGVDGEWDEEIARGEVSWAETQAAT